MRWAFASAASVLAFVGIAGPAPTGKTPDEFLSKVAIAPSFSGGEATGSIDRSATWQSLPLTDEQRGFVFLCVINLPDTPDADVAAPAPAASLPETVELHEIPAMVLGRIPILRDYKFVKLDDRILLVRPADRAVVSEIPRYRLLP